jgi:ABC-type multidrug transport system ATPase subunit
MNAAPSETKTVFVSYSTADRTFAVKFVEALRSRLFNDMPYGATPEIWWDLDTIPIGRDWSEFLLDKVTSAACTVVLWSKRSVASEWVVREAEIAARRGVLCPVLIEDVPLPSQFSRIQTARLTDWKPGSQDSQLQRISAGVRHFLETAPSSAEATRGLKESQRSAEQRARRLFLDNCRSETRLEHVELTNTPMYPDLSWNLTAGMNILLGRNGYGKSHLIRTLLSLLQYDDPNAVKTLDKGSASITLVQDGEDRAIDFADQFFDEEHAVGKIPILAIPDMRFLNRSVTTLSAISDETTGKEDRADLSAYGAWHFLEERPFESMIQSFLYGLCLDYFDSNLQFGPEFQMVRDVVRQLTDGTFDFDRVAREGRDRFTLYVRTEGNGGIPLPIQKASQGTLSVIAMFGLIYEFLKSLRQKRQNIQQRSGIVVIDEVDAHLHPVWQQKIVSLLRETYPRVQFILTAHNPISVAGCLEDEVSVLRKEERGFTLVQFPNDFVGWQTEEIYRKVFEIEQADATFAMYDSLRPFKTQLEQEAVALSKNAGKDATAARTLDDVQEKLLYISKAEQARTRRITVEELERENRMLRERLVGLEAQQERGREK